MPEFVEAVVHPGRRLGWRPKDPARPVLRLSNYLTGTAVPAHPALVDHYAKVPSWILGMNNVHGTCGPTSVANHLLMTTTYLGTSVLRPTDAQVIDLYKRSGNPDFPAQDEGVDMTVMLSALNKTGIAGRKCIAFAAVDASNLDELRLAIDLFGGVLDGAVLDIAQQGQTDQGLWDYVPSTGIWGGHAFLEGHYESQARRDGKVVTWAELIDMTTAFEARQVQEAYVVLWDENVNTPGFDVAINRAQLAADYTEITGRPFPAAVPPVPPPPTPGPLPPKPPPGVLQWLRDLVAWLERWFN